MKKCFVLILFLVPQLVVKAQQKDSAFILRTAKELILSVRNCALVTTNADGFPSARTMDPFPPEENLVIWLATNPRSQKVKEIQANPKAAIYFTQPEWPGYLTLRGHATIVNDPKEKEKRWKEEWKNFYQNRTTEYLLIRFEPHQLEIVSYKHNLLGDSLTWKAPTLRVK